MVRGRELSGVPGAGDCMELVRMFNALRLDVAYALLRAVSPLMGTRVFSRTDVSPGSTDCWRADRCREESRHGTHECVRYVGSLPPLRGGEARFRVPVVSSHSHWMLLRPSSRWMSSCSVSGLVASECRPSASMRFPEAISAVAQVIRHADLTRNNMLLA